MSGVLARVEQRIGQRLEEGRFGGAPMRLLARVLVPLTMRSVRRPLRLPRGVASIVVGGATLGGSGKTRVALACVEALVARGARVVLVGHAYRASPKRARVVSIDDSLAEVGDEALACARGLGSRASVVVAPTRQAAVDLAVSLDAEVIVIDGPLQTTPRASLALLAIDRDRPWGSGVLVPSGDLRAPPDGLIAEVDHLVSVDASGSVDEAVAVATARFSSEHGGRAPRLGLFTAVGRPARLVRTLNGPRAPARPVRIVSIRDHGPLSSRDLAALRQAEAEVDVWLATPKCGEHVRSILTRPLHLVSAAISLPPLVESAIERVLTSTRLHGLP